MSRFILAGLEVELHDLPQEMFAGLAEEVIKSYAALERIKSQYLEETGADPGQKSIVFQDLGAFVNGLEGRFGKRVSFERMREDIDEIGILFGRKYGVPYQPIASPER